MIALVATGGAGFYSAYNQAEEIYDTELSHVARLMLAVLRAEDQEEIKHGRRDDDDEGVNSDIIELGNDFNDSGQRHDRKLAFRIWRHEKLLFYSSEAKEFGEKRTIGGFSNQDVDGNEWRVFVLSDPSGYTLEVAQKIDIRERLIAEVLATIFSPLVLLLPVIVVLVWLSLRSGLKPLVAVSEAVRRRSSLDLAPLPPDQNIMEIRPLIDAINGLLANLDYALEKERRFTDLAAHELRTPIAIFKTQAQTALKATDEAQRHSILEAQVKAADRVTAMVDQLLTLARLEHTDIPTEKLPINDIAQAIIEERQPLAQSKQILLHLEAPDQLSILGNKDMLTTILTNLIDNAVKYTPVHGEVAVTISDMAVTVRDNGPGIPEESLPFVTERFYRVKRQQQPGAGLGLTIVKRAADIMGATLMLRNSPSGSGLEARLQFSLNPSLKN